jgi:hypothetical protein
MQKHPLKMNHFFLCKFLKYIPTLKFICISLLTDLYSHGLVLFLFRLSLTSHLLLLPSLGSTNIELTFSLDQVTKRKKLNLLKMSLLENLLASHVYTDMNRCHLFSSPSTNKGLKIQSIIMWLGQK